MRSYAKALFLLCLAVGGGREARAQPEWFGDPPASTAAVTFVTGAGEGTTRAQARRSAYRSALRQLVRRDSATVSSALFENAREVLRESAASGLEGEVREEVRAKMKVDRPATAVPGLRPVARAHRQTGDGVRAWSLFAVPRRAGTDGGDLRRHLSRLRARRRRAVRWRSFVPGLAQFYKGQQAKGLLFLGGEAALGGLVLTGLYGQKRLEEKIRRAASGPRRRAFESAKSRLTAMTWAGAALAGALYAWNVADGWTTGSERFPLLSARFEEGPVRGIQVAPTATPRSAGVKVALTLR